MSEKILLIRLRELGDKLLTTPLVRQVRRLHPGAQIDVLCQKANACVFEHNHQIDHTFKLLPRASISEFLAVASELRRRRYDLVVDVQSLPKTAIMARLTGGRERIGYLKRGWRNRLCYTRPYRQHIVEYAARQHLRLLQDDRIDMDDIDLDFPVGPDTSAEADAFCRKYLRPPFAAIFGVCRFGYREWAPEKTAAVADRLAALGIQPWLVYGPGQAKATGEIAARMRHHAVHEYDMPSFATLGAILSRSTLFFGGDGGPKHAAVAAGIPTVTVCRADHASGWAPPNTARHRVVTTRAYPGLAPFVGTFTDATTIAEIPVEAVWKQIAQTLRQQGDAGLQVPSRKARAA